MTDYTRGDYGRFGLKSDTPRKVRSVNLTDSAWDWLASTAKQEEMSRNDFLETLAEVQRYPFMETVEEQPAEPIEDKVTPLMETVERLQAELAKVKAERKELDNECKDIQEKHGKAVLDIQLLEEQLANLQAKPTDVNGQSQSEPLMETAASAVELAELGVAVSKFNGKKSAKAKIKLDDVREVLRLMGVEV